MSRDDLYTLFTSLNGDENIEEGLFDAYLDIAQATWEQTRPWMILRAVDESQTVTPGTTISTAFSLPDDFSRWYDPERSVGLWDGTAMSYVLQVPLALAKGTHTVRFFVDLAAGTIGLTGSFGKSYALHQFYVKDAPLVSGGNVWAFPEKWHKFLALSAAVYYKLGVDYDLVNNAQGDQHAAMAKALLDAAEKWDDELQSATLAGLGVEGSWTGGRVDLP